MLLEFRNFCFLVSALILVLAYKTADLKLDVKVTMKLLVKCVLLFCTSVTHIHTILTAIFQVTLSKPVAPLMHKLQSCLIHDLLFLPISTIESRVS